MATKNRDDVAGRALARAVSPMDSCYADRLDLGTLCDDAHFSRSHFIRTFRSRLFETPHQYIIREPGLVQQPLPPHRRLAALGLPRALLRAKAQPEKVHSRLLLDHVRFRGEAPGRLTAGTQVGNFREARGTTMPVHSGEEECRTATISHINVFVRDQKKAYEVYVGKLGFEVNADITMDGGMRWLTVTPPGHPDIEMLLAEPCVPMMKPDVVSHVRAVLDADAMPGGVWKTDDCEKSYQEMKRKGIEFIMRQLVFAHPEAVQGIGRVRSLRRPPGQVISTPARARRG